MYKKTFFVALQLIFFNNLLFSSKQFDFNNLLFSSKQFEKEKVNDKNNFEKKSYVQKFKKSISSISDDNPDFNEMNICDCCFNKNLQCSQKYNNKSIFFNNKNMIKSASIEEAFFVKQK